MLSTGGEAQTQGFGRGVNGITVFLNGTGEAPTGIMQRYRRLSGRQLQVEGWLQRQKRRVASKAKVQVVYTMKGKETSVNGVRPGTPLAVGKIVRIGTRSCG